MNNNTDNEVVMYLLIRTDLKMSTGKMCAQAAHAAHLTIRMVETSGSDDTYKTLHHWENKSYPKITLGIPDEDTLASVCKALSEQNIMFVPVVDEGRTEIPPGTTTAVGVQPVPRDVTKKILGSLRLL